MADSTQLRRILAVCHDAGAAALIGALASTHRHTLDWRLMSVPGAPAWGEFQRRGLGERLWDGDQIGNPNDSWDQFNPDLLLFGTGWQRQLQDPWLALARVRGVPSLALLDHWVNYRERFGYPAPHWRERLPEHVGVGDPWARSLAQDLALPGLVSLRNPHFQELLNQFQAQRRLGAGENRLLLLTEPTSKAALARFGVADYWGFTEADFLSSVLGNLDAFDVESLTLRLHPSDNASVYQSILSRHTALPWELERVSERSLGASLARCRWVLGPDSFALFAAYLVGLPALCYLPGGRRTCKIPLPAANQVTRLEGLDLARLEQLPDPAPLLRFGLELPEWVQTLPSYR